MVKRIEYVRKRIFIRVYRKIKIIKIIGFKNTDLKQKCRLRSKQGGEGRK